MKQTPSSSSWSQPQIAAGAQFPYFPFLITPKSAHGKTLTLHINWKSSSNVHSPMTFIKIIQMFYLRDSIIVNMPKLATAE